VVSPKSVIFTTEPQSSQRKPKFLGRAPFLQKRQELNLTGMKGVNGKKENFHRQLATAELTCEGGFLKLNQIQPD